MSKCLLLADDRLFTYCCIVRFNPAYLLISIVPVLGLRSLPSENPICKIGMLPLKALSLSQLADFLLDASCTSEFEVFPQAATFPQKEKTTFNSGLTSPSSFYSKASIPGSAVTLTGLGMQAHLIISVPTMKPACALRAIAKCAQSGKPPSQSRRRVCHCFVC